MNSEVPAGTYILGVSGGVDSVVLLDVLARQEQVQLIVAHFDHGIRADSGEDRQLVQALAEKYGLPFEYDEGTLGQDASEDKARTARYDFLQSVQQKYKADGIITAHHQDDLLETAILNLLRGTGRKGLTSLASNPNVIRPLLKFSKQEIRDHAQKNQLQWREDSTNASPKYLRNYIRLNIVPRLPEWDKNRLLEIIEHSRGVNAELDALLAGLLPLEGNRLERSAFIKLPHAAAREIMAAWLRANDLRNFDRITVERLVIAAKTGRPGTRVNVYGQHVVDVTKNYLALNRFER